MIGGGLGAAGSIAGAALSSNAAGNAADAQANAANNASQLDYQASQNALDFQKQQYATSQQELQPWLQYGTGALSQLGYLMGVGPESYTGQAAPGTNTPFNASIGNTSTPTGPYNPNRVAPAQSQLQQTNPGLNTYNPNGQNPAPVGGSGMVSGPIQFNGQPGGPQTVGSGVPAGTNLGTYGSLMAQYPGGQFTAPTADQARQTPGYQFALDQGKNAIQASAAANGSLLTGGTMTALDQYAQGLADTNYNNVYNQALNTYNTNYNTWSNQNANEFNRLAAISGIGQTTAQQLGTLGQSSANGITNNLLSTAANIGDQGRNAAAATASGYYNQAQAINGGISGSLSALNQYQQLMNMQNYGGGGGGYLPGLGDAIPGVDQG